MGTPEFALPALTALARLTSVQAVVAQPDKASGRGQSVGSPPTVTWARAQGLAVLQPARARDESFVAALAALDLDLIVVAAYGKILPRAVLEAPRLGCVNVHASLLPKYRGAAPIQWAIARGDSEAGITLMQMEEGLDTGPMLSRASVAIGPEETGGELTARLATLGGELLASSLPAILDRKLVAVPQDPALATLAPKLTREDALLDLNRPARELHDRVRAFQPWPGAVLRIPGEGTLKVIEARTALESGGPGTVLAAGKEGITLAAGEGALRLLVVQPEGKRRMSAAEFLAGHPMRVGERLG
jgi:methionyl-tRNA formyltransferase